MKDCSCWSTDLDTLPPAPLSSPPPAHRSSPLPTTGLGPCILPPATISCVTFPPHLCQRLSAVPVLACHTFSLLRCSLPWPTHTTPPSAVSEPIHAPIHRLPVAVVPLTLRVGTSSHTSSSSRALLLEVLHLASGKTPPSIVCPLHAFPAISVSRAIRVHASQTSVRSPQQIQTHSSAACQYSL
jgi:hypothetical protein